MWHHNEYNQHVIGYSATQSSIYANFFSVEKKVAKINTTALPTCVYAT